MSAQGSIGSNSSPEPNVVLPPPETDHSHPRNEHQDPETFQSLTRAREGLQNTRRLVRVIRKKVQRLRENVQDARDKLIREINEHRESIDQYYEKLRVAQDELGAAQGEHDTLERRLDEEEEYLRHAEEDFYRHSRVLIMEEMDVEEAVNQQGQPIKRYMLMLIAASEVFLAPVTFVSAMIAEHDDSWKPVFMGLFSSWITLLGIGVYIDLHRLQRAQFIKRSLWHLGSCILMLYIIVSTTQLTADTLPQWIPLIIDCGLGVSIGIQNIPPNTRQQLWRQLNELVGSFCGGVQVSFQGGYSGPHQSPASEEAGEL